jgi:hypothetical protein
MPRTPRTRLIEVALRCYPRRWRDHHGDEAAELAELLVGDGVPALFVVGSYLKGAARERLITRPSRRLLPAVGALLVGASLIGVPLVLLDSSTPANAASGNDVVAMIVSHQRAVEQLESVFKLHHFKIRVVEVPSPPSRAGSILAVNVGPVQDGERGVLREIPGPCITGASGCIDGVALPLHYAGTAQVFVGSGTKPGKTAPESANGRLNYKVPGHTTLKHRTTKKN